MDEKIFIEELKDLIDTEMELNPETKLKDVEDDGWDSLSIISFIAYCRKHGTDNITSKEISEAVTVHDLFILFGGEKR